MFPEFGHKLEKTSKSSQISPQTFPKCSPNPSKTLPNSTQKASWSPSWSHAWKKLYFERPKYEQKSPKSGPKRPQTVPTPSQMRPKTLQIRFFGEFLACYLQLYNFFVFCSNFSWISHVFVRADLQNSCAHAAFCWLPHVLACFEKSIKNHRKTFPKPIPNRGKIKEKSEQIDGKSQDEWGKPKNALQMRKKCKKWANMSQLGAPRPKTRRPRRDGEPPLSTP